MSLLIILLTLGFVPTPALAEEISSINVEYSTSTAPLVLNYFAHKYGIDSEEFVGTAECESHFKAGAIGDGGSSYGIFQIHLPAHPDITKEQAQDPWWAAEWSAKQFAAGKQAMWTCWRKLYGPRPL